MKPEPARPDWQDRVLFALGLGGGLVGVFVALVLAAMAILVAVSGDPQGGVTVQWLAVAVGATALGGVPLVYWTARPLFGRPAPTPRRPSRAWGWIGLAFPAAIALGYLASRAGALGGLLWPLAQVLAASIPVALIVLTVRRLGPPISPRRAWGQLLAGLWAASAMALAAELLMIIPVGLLFLVGLSSSPTGRQLLESVAGQGKAISPETLAPQVEALVLQPWSILLVLAYMSVLVPLVEEMAKTVGLWPLLRRRLTPAEAFLGGVLTGSGYALFEAFFLPQPGTDWAGTMISRVGATLMHAFTAGLTGWGLREAFVRKRPLRLAGCYIASTLVHGTWNAAAITIGLSALPAQTAAGGTLWNVVAIGGIVVLLVLTGLAAAGIPWLAYRLRGQEVAAPEVAAPPASQSASGE